MFRSAVLALLLAAPAALAQSPHVGHGAPAVAAAASYAHDA